MGTGRQAGRQADGRWLRCRARRLAVRCSRAGPAGVDGEGCCAVLTGRCRRAQMFHGQVLQMLYGGSPNVSFFKGDGEPQLGPILDMPDNSSSGGVSCAQRGRVQRGPAFAGRSGHAFPRSRGSVMRMIQSSLRMIETLSPPASPAWPRT